jgi:hypothetical protein
MKAWILALSTIALSLPSIAHAEDHATGGGGVFLADATLNERTIEGVLDAALHRSLDTKATGFSLNNEEKDFLKKWVAQRNEVAHGRKKAVDHRGLQVFLLFVQRLLYKLDVCRGHSWANRFTLRADGDNDDESGSAGSAMAGFSEL